MLEVILTALAGLAIAVLKVLIARHGKKKKESKNVKIASDNLDKRDRILERVHDRRAKRDV